MTARGVTSLVDGRVADHLEHFHDLQARMTPHSYRDSAMAKPSDGDNLHFGQVPQTTGNSHESKPVIDWLNRLIPRIKAQLHGTDREWAEDLVLR